MWPEVQKVKDENRYELVLSSEEVKRRIDDEDGIEKSGVFELSHLNFLRVSKTNLVSVSSKLSELNNLTNLTLQYNKLESLPDTIGDLKALKLLDASFNQLSTLPDGIAKLSNLMTLNLIGNRLNCLPSFKGCNSLAHLDMSHNELGDFPDICHESLLHLADVHLSNNAISEVPSSVSVLQSLKLLNMCENKLQSIPGDILQCPKFKDAQLKGNPLTDKRLKKLVESNRCLPRQVVDYIRQHAPKDNKKKGKKEGAAEATVDEVCNKLTVMNLSDDGPIVCVSANVKEERPFIVCFIMLDLDLTGDSFKKFIVMQTKLHDGVCEKRLAATIATHDLQLVSGPLRYTCRNPDNISLQPLQRSKVMPAKKYFDSLLAEAEALRKQSKRNTVGGLHKYLHLVEKSTSWPCLVDSNDVVISLPPITNSDATKMTPDSKAVFVEVTSSRSLPTAKSVAEALIRQTLQLQQGNTGHKKLTLQQVRVEDEEGNLKVVYPSRADLNWSDQNVRVIRQDK